MSEKCLHPDCVNRRDGALRWCMSCSMNLSGEDKWYVIGLMAPEGYPGDMVSYRRAYEMGKADRER